MTKKTKFLLVYAHPNEASFNHALLRVTRAALEGAGHEVRVHDLYALGFDPVLATEDFAAQKAGSQRADVAALQADVSWAERLFFTYPIWWYGRPAILQGWLDRVLSYGFAFKTAGGQPVGLLPQDRALVFQTTGIAEAAYAEQDAGAGNTTIHYAMNEGTLGFCGVPDVRMHTFYAVSSHSKAERQRMLDLAVDLVHKFAA